MPRSDRDREMRDRLCGWIRYEMEKATVTQNDIARRMGRGSGALSKYMNGDEIPSCGFVLAVASALHEVALSVLIFQDPEPKYMQQRPTPRRAS